MRKFKEGDLVKIIDGQILPESNEELRGKAMRVYKLTKDEVLVEYEGDTYGFIPHELELTSKLHEILE